jgi:glycosyltransferase involved in cell wall biosynthesis
MTQPDSISIVIPIYNEERTLVGATQDLLVGLERTGLTFEVILAENGSADATAALADDLARRDRRIRVIHLPSPDYGQALRQGFLAGTGDCLLNFSIDFVDLEFLQTALGRLAGCDMVIGSKYVAQGHDHRPWRRQVGGRLLSGFVRTLFRIPYADTHGLLALRRKRVVALVERCRFGHEIFDTELIVRAHRAGLALCEVPVRVEEQRPSRTGTLRRALRMLAQFVRLRWDLWQENRP